LTVTNPLKIWSSLADFAGVMQRAQRKPSILDSQGDDMLPPGDHDLADGHFVCLSHRFTDHPKSILRDRTVRGHVVRLIEEYGINFVDRHKLYQIDRLARFDLNLFEVRLVNDDVLVLLILIALDNVIALELAVLRANQLLANAMIAILMQLVERD